MASPDPIYYLITPVATFFFFWILEIWKNAIAKRQRDREIINALLMELFENKNYFSRAKRYVENFQSKENCLITNLDLNFQTSHWKNLSGEIPLDGNDLAILMDAYSAMSIVYGMTKHEITGLPSHEESRKDYKEGFMDGFRGAIFEALAESIGTLVLPAIDPALDALAKRKVALSKTGILPYMVEIFSPKLASRIRRMEERNASK